MGKAGATKLQHLRLGQGKENTRQFLIDNQDISQEIEVRVRAAVGLDREEPTAEVTEEAPEEVAADGG